MLDFREVTLEMKPLADSYLRPSGNMGSEYTFSNIFIWRKNYYTAIAEKDGFLFVRYIINGQYYFLMPVGAGREADIGIALRYLIEYSRENDLKLVVAGITAEGVAVIEKRLPGIFDFKKKPDWYDYIYNADDLIHLRGSKYQAKRNHINKFENLKGRDTFENLGKDNIGDCLRTYIKWAEGREGESLTSEYSAVVEALNNFEALGLKGGLSRSGGHVCAFTLGAAINDEVFVIHTEKGLIECTGVYAAINRDFAKNNCTGFKYINREEDMGLEGLRKAKRSYYPVILLEKYVAVLKNGGND